MEGFVLFVTHLEEKTSGVFFVNPKRNLLLLIGSVLHQSVFFN